MVNEKKATEDLHMAAVKAAQSASIALQKLISPETRLVVAEVEALQNPHELDAQKLAERCIEYYKQDKITVSTSVKLYNNDGSKEESGVMLMFIDQKDYHTLGMMILSKLKNDEQRFSANVEESAITEILNIIGNAYISVLAEYYQLTLMSMVPKIVDASTFDNFIGSIVSDTRNKTYVLFDTNLMITENIIRLPFLLAVALKNK
jgi:chemotaxis protein CheY-P-specific phosphatase CheC